MKTFVCIIGFFGALALVNCEPSQEMKKLFEECGKEVGITELPNGPPNFDDSKQKCLQACIMKKGGSLVDGKINVEKAVEFTSKHVPGGTTDAFKAVINECTPKANEEKDECDVAGSFGKCMMEKLPKP